MNRYIVRWINRYNKLLDRSTLSWENWISGYIELKR